MSAFDNQYKLHEKSMQRNKLQEQFIVDWNHTLNIG